MSRTDIYATQRTDKVLIFLLKQVLIQQGLEGGWIDIYKMSSLFAKRRGPRKISTNEEDDENEPGTSAPRLSHYRLDYTNRT